MEKRRAVEEGIYNVQLILSKSLEDRRTELELVLLAAQRRIANFAEKHSWKDLTQESFFDRAEIYDTKEAFDRALAKISDEDEQIELPKTYSAALEKRVLMAVSPELYSQNYPEGVEQGSYEKLLAHEIAHRLHIRILDGDENAMGPVWFFEGFAIYAADQFVNDSSSLKPTEIQGIIPESKRTSYRKYGKLFRHLASKSSVQELTKHAGKSDFETWLQEINKNDV